ncbi:sensor domain-containing diguanylate cyclase [Poseidonibacter sp.]|uniref:sensor domain-containing diguanylate cyclase n=1 Tax=Poseidonibacter sp. TaxID=2321188 RepID=UPI003C727EA7
MYNNFRKLFSLYFIIYGFIISLFCISISYYFQTKQIEKDVAIDAKEIYEIKIKSILMPHMSDMDNIIKVLAGNIATKNFSKLKDETNRKYLEQIFHAVTSSNKMIMQARYIDKNGKEVIRVERDKSGKNVIITNKKELQDKSNRDYFIKLSNMEDKSIWHSRFDLNIENNKVEIPYKPTIRIATPIFEKKKFSGIIILNLSTNNLFNSIRNSTAFDHFIIDKNRNYILHPQDKFSFNKYKKIIKDIDDDFPKGFETNNTFVYSLKDIFHNEDDAIFVLKTKKDYEKKLFTQKLNILGIVLVLTFFISLIMAFMVSKIPTRLQNALFRANQKLEISQIVKNYVISATTKVDSTILDISDAFMKSSGYSKKELIGKPMSIIKNKDRDKKIIKQLWKTILKGEVWIGEIKNTKKNGQIYWLEQHIIPKMDKNNKIEKFVSIGIDITAKKELEKLASIDQLTGIYNRRMIEEFLQVEIDIAKRHEYDLSLIMIDIDFFKTVNDNHGHPIGDEVLNQIAKVISNNLRKSDIFGRYGGEEFLIICVETNANDAFTLSEKLRLAVGSHKFDDIGYKTISLGVTNLKIADTLETLVKRADLALYKAKEEGRNKTVIEVT